MDETTVDICIVTFKGGALLETLLSSLRVVESAGMRLRVVLVDNDSEQSALAVASKFDNIKEFELHYCCEEKRGIPYARNKALDLLSADYFAFLDDDEYVNRGWLITMLAALKQFDADFVFGPVRKKLPEHSPGWAIDHPAFQAVEGVTGASLQFGASNNVVGSVKSVRESGFRFDPAFAKSGAEDTDFFHRFYRSGYKLIWCEEGAINEEVPSYRTTKAWVRRRALRGGQGFYRIVVRNYPVLKRIAWICLLCFRFAIETCLLPILGLFSKKYHMKVLYKWWGHLGQISMCFGDKFVYYEYAEENYRTNL